MRSWRGRRSSEGRNPLFPEVGIPAKRAVCPGSSSRRTGILEVRDVLAELRFTSAGMMTSVSIANAAIGTRKGKARSLREVWPGSGWPRCKVDVILTKGGVASVSVRRREANLFFSSVSKGSLSFMSQFG